MAFSGYLIKLGGSSGAELPMRFMVVESYNSTPNQRMEVKANRAVTGLLHRTTVEHTATKIEFETPYMTNLDRVQLNSLLSANWTNALERKITLNYYDEETDTYKNGEFYVPDVKYTIDHIDLESNLIYYQPVRYAFIEY